jgi:hypothetical protein
MHRSRSIALAALCAALLGGMLPAAHADFIPEDSRFGADTLILDTDTGIRWLKLDATLGVSFNDVAANLDAGERYAGFTIASKFDVGRLFVDAGFPNYQQVPVGKVYTAAELAAGPSFTELFGGVVYASGDGRSAGKVAEAIFPGLNYGAAMYWSATRGGEWYDDASNFGFNDVARADSGTWLMAAIPEPSTYALMLAGLALVGVSARRRGPHA